MNNILIEKRASLNDSTYKACPCLRLHVIGYVSTESASWLRASAIGLPAEYGRADSHLPPWPEAELILDPPGRRSAATKQSRFAITTVPNFFQDETDEALRSQVNWQKQHLGLGDRFFARLLRVDQDRFSSWANSAADLATQKMDVLREWWRTVLHLLSFQNFDEERVQVLLQRTPPPRPHASQSLFAPPWSGSSLQEYLEQRGPEAIPEVNRWVESFRFGDPYAPAPRGRTWVSTRP